jgi:hypothetical protein
MNSLVIFPTYFMQAFFNLDSNTPKLKRCVIKVRKEFFFQHDSETNFFKHVPMTPTKCLKTIAACNLFITKKETQKHLPRFRHLVVVGELNSPSDPNGPSCY